MKYVKLFDNFIESKKNKDSLNDDKSIIPKVNYGDKEDSDDEETPHQKKQEPKENKEKDESKEIHDKKTSNEVKKNVAKEEPK